MLTVETRRRLADLLPRLGSEAPGEVVATATAVVRVLKSSGADLHDLAALVLAAQVPEGRPDDSTPDWRIQVETALRLQLWKSDWEFNFLRGLQNWNGADISARQEAVLERIFLRGEK